MTNKKHHGKSLAPTNLTMKISESKLIKWLFPSNSSYTVTIFSDHKSWKNCSLHLWGIKCVLIYGQTEWKVPYLVKSFDRVCDRSSWSLLWPSIHSCLLQACIEKVSSTTLEKEVLHHFQNGAILHNAVNIVWTCWTIVWIEGETWKMPHQQ